MAFEGRRLQFATRRVCKIYLALVHGHAVQCSLVAPLMRREGRTTVDSRGRSAKTELLKAS